MFSKKTQKGNALWFILIAIFLLGMLTMLITRTSGTSEDTGNVEGASIKASEIIAYFNTLQAGVSKLMANGCSESNLSFGNTFYKWEDGSTPWNDATYPKAPINKSCHLFDVNGAGISPKAFPAEKYGAATGNAINYREEGTLALDAITAIIPGLGTNAPELLAHLGFIDMATCNEINKRNGIGLYKGQNAGYVLDAVQGYAPPPIVGTTGYYQNNIVNDVDGSSMPLIPFNNDLNGKKIFCAANTDRSDNASGWSFAFVVLLVR
jgi:hypothetical protein